MSTQVDDLLTTGDQALASGDWSTARDAFQAAVDAAPTGESGRALLGLGNALWWLGEITESIECKERAYAAFRRGEEPLAATLVAWQLSLDYGDSLGNTAAGSGWLGRARRLAEDHGLTMAQGWVLLLDAHYTTDPEECERLARHVLDVARDNRDPALHLCALGQLGAALVDQGRIVDGVRMLDEAMAGTLAGEAGQPDPVVFTSCLTLQACTSCADFERAVQWLRATDRFSQRFGSPYVRADCRIHYADVLVTIGDWTQAEEELAHAITLSAGASPVLQGDALAAKAQLRLAQGRLEEAARLVEGLAGHPGAAAVTGRIHLLQDRPESACSVLRRGLAALGPDRLRSLTMRELLGEALLACGDTAAAQQHAAALTEFATSRDCRVARAFDTRLRGRVHAATGDSAGACEHLDAALASFVELGMPYEAARTRLLLASALRNRSRQAAIDEAHTAMAALDGLGARHDADAAAALLRQLGASATRNGRRGAESLTRREQEVLRLLGEGLSNPEIAGRLYLSRKTVEHHVARVLSKLGLRSRAEAAAEAVRLGLRDGR